MKLGVYSRPDGSGPLILVAECLLPPIEAEHSHGPLAYRGLVDADWLPHGVKSVLLAAILDASYATLDSGQFPHAIFPVLNAANDPPPVG